MIFTFHFARRKEHCFFSTLVPKKLLYIVKLLRFQVFAQNIKTFSIHANFLIRLSLPINEVMAIFLSTKDLNRCPLHCIIKSATFLYFSINYSLNSNYSQF